MREETEMGEYGQQKTANGAKLVSGSWCTQQDSNLWPFDS